MKKHLLLIFTLLLSICSYAQDGNEANSAQLSDATIYKGRKKKGIPHGYGTCNWPDGKVYEGNWREGIMSGEGTMFYPNGDKYSGEWTRGQKDGRGTYTWKNKDRYIGGYQKGVREGWGVLRFANGDVYEGYWKNDVAFGKGLFTWKNGDYYTGEWKNNLRHGKGTMVYADGGIQQGEWKDGEYLPCECEGKASVKEAFESSEIVVAGRVLSISPGENGSSRSLVRLKVTEYWKGELGVNGVLLLSAGNSSCDMIYFEDGEYLLFLQKSPFLSYVTDQCSPSGDRFFKELAVMELNDLVACEGEAAPAYYSNGVTEKVCGCDGQTYPSARKAAQNGIKRWTLGECEKPKEE